MKNMTYTLIALLTALSLHGAVADMHAPKDGRPDRDHMRQPVERWMDMMKERNPEEFERLDTLRKEDLPAFRKEMMEKLKNMRERVRGVLDGVDGDQPQHGPRRGFEPSSPEIKEAQKEVRSLVKEYRQADAETKTEVYGQIREVLTRLFDLREAERAEKLDKMAEKVEKLKDDLAERQEQKDKIIDRRLEELTGTLPPW